MSLIIQHTESTQDVLISLTRAESAERTTGKEYSEQMRKHAEMEKQQTILSFQMKAILFFLKKKSNLINSPQYSLWTLH